MSVCTDPYKSRYTNAKQVAVLFTIQYKKLWKSDTKKTTSELTLSWDFHTNKCQSIHVLTKKYFCKLKKNNNKRTAGEISVCTK
jgi:hypothetical protein